MALDPRDRPPLDSLGCLTVDIACLRCGYNLRGLREEGACPECASAVGLSTRGSFLKFADPQWVGTLAKGLKIILWNILFTIVGYAALFAAVALSTPLIPYATILLVAATFVGLLGTWLLTAPDPGHVGEDRFSRARAISRVGLLAIVTASLLQLVQSVVPSSPSMELIAEIATFGLGIVMLVGQFFMFVYIEHLASRIPDPPLTNRARLLRWTVLIANCTLMLSEILKKIGSTQKAQAWQLAAAIPAIFGGLLMLVFGIACLVFYFRLSNRLNEQADLARTTWARDVALAEIRRSGV